jgi:hypothetical protein
MHLKVRGRTAHVYRSHWTPRGAVGNTHGFNRPEYVGSLRLDCQAVPDALRSLLNDAEVQQLEQRVCQPARAAAAQALREATAREVDPLWRLEEARRLLVDAAQRSQACRVPRSALQPLQDALTAMQTLEPAEASRAPERRPDPLQEALTSLRAAMTAVRNGAYGTAPDSGVRSTRTYRLWADIYSTVSGSTGDTLLRALQDRGFAKAKGR